MIAVERRSNALIRGLMIYDPDTYRVVKRLGAILGMAYMMRRVWDELRHLCRTDRGLVMEALGLPSRTGTSPGTPMRFTRFG